MGLVSPSDPKPTLVGAAIARSILGSSRDPFPAFRTLRAAPQRLLRCHSHTQTPPCRPSSGWCGDPLPEPGRVTSDVHPLVSSGTIRPLIPAPATSGFPPCAMCRFAPRSAETKFRCLSDPPKGCPSSSISSPRRVSTPRSLATPRRPPSTSTSHSWYTGPSR